MKSQLTVFAHEVDALVRQHEGDAYQAIVDQLEKPMIAAALIANGCNQTKTAIALGLNRGTLRKKIIKHGLFGKNRRELSNILLPAKAA